MTANSFYLKKNNYLGNSHKDALDGRSIALVGKGVCYDTGGLNLKGKYNHIVLSLLYGNHFTYFHYSLELGANSMRTMKHDMTGSSIALGLFYSLSKLRDHGLLKDPIECWLPIVENNINVNAYRPDDVVCSITGETIEVVHTDAEGRMLLADVLPLASRKVVKKEIHKNFVDEERPKLIIDFATLTGTCISSLSNRYIGSFSNRNYLNDIVMKAGVNTGDRAWPFPLDDDFGDDLKSDIADLLQCRQSTEADHIYAAYFLKNFVCPKVPWIHLDIGSAYRPGGLGQVSSDYTGSGVRLGWEIIDKL